MSDSSDPAPGTPEPRKPRASVMLSATLERFGGAPSRHRVRDLSPDGMRIDQAQDLRTGATVLVSVGALQTIGASVVWIEDGSAGLKFAEPIDPDAARARAAITPRVATPARPAGPSAGWVPDQIDPYRKR